MLELKLGFRPVAFLFLISSFFTCSVQSCWDHFTPGLYNVEQRKDIAPVSHYKYINTNTSEDILNYISIPNANFTTAKLFESCNSYSYNLLPDTGNIIVIMNCTCRDSTISINSGSFTFTWVAISEKHSGLNRSYNPPVDFDVPSNTSLQNSLGRGPIIRALNVTYVYYRNRVDTIDDIAYVKHRVLGLKSCSEPRLSDGTIVGITIGVVALVLLLARCLYNGVYRKKNAERSSELLKNPEVQLMPAQAPIGSSNISSESSGALAAELTDIVDKAVEFSYEELSKATNDFSLGNKIGQGGFGAVYYAELRGKVWN